MAWARLRGIDVVERNLNKEIRAIEGRTMKGLLEAAAFVRADMDKTPPLIPVDTGDLRSSWFVVPSKMIRFKAVMMGFSANYAVFVHEMLDEIYEKKINWKRKGSGPKFFEASLKRNTLKILAIIRKNAKIR